jgi:hypothetical protein
LYNFFSYLKRLGRFWGQPADVPRRCIFDQRYGCAIPQPIPTQSLGTTFDLQAMANNCGYTGGPGYWWHVHHSAPAFYGGMAQSCPHSYKPGHEAQARLCKCQKMEFWQEKIKQYAERG